MRTSLGCFFHPLGSLSQCCKSLAQELRNQQDSTGPDVRLVDCKFMRDERLEVVTVVDPVTSTFPRDEARIEEVPGRILLDDAACAARPSGDLLDGIGAGAVLHQESQEPTFE